MEMTIKPDKEMQGEKQERARMIFVSAVVPRFMSFWIGSVKQITDSKRYLKWLRWSYQLQLPHNRNHPHQWSADIDNHIVVAPN